MRLIAGIFDVLRSVARFSGGRNELAVTRDRHGQVVEVRGHVEWRVVPLDETGRWMAECDALNVVIDADTRSALRNEADEATRIVLDDVVGDRELDQFLGDRGWIRNGDRYAYQRDRRSADPIISVSPMVVVGEHASAIAAG